MYCKRFAQPRWGNFSLDQADKAAIQGGESMEMDVWNLGKGLNPPSKNWNLVSMISLASDFKRTQMTEDNLWRVLLKHRWSEDIFKTSGVVQTRNKCQK